MHCRKLVFCVVALALLWVRDAYAVVGCGNTPSTGTSQVQVSPATLFFSLAPGAVVLRTLAISEIRINSQGIGSADGWRHSKNVTWLTVTPSSGTCPGGGPCTAASVAIEAPMSPGTHTGRIDFTAFHCNANPVTGSTVSISVNLQVGAAVIALSATSLSFSGQVSGSAPAAQEVTISNAGTGTMNWNAIVVSGGNWLQVSPNTGTDTGTIRASANITGLTEGNYFGTIEVSSAGANNSPLRINATLVMSAAGRATIALNPTSMQFSAQVGVNPAPQSFEVRNSGSGTLTWTATASVPWLGVNPTGGVAPSTITVTVTSASLAAGTHNGSITISSNATNSPQVLPVTLSVSGACSLPEPPLNISLQPGFHIAEVRLSPGAIEGYWGMEFLAPRGILSGGFNLGGGVQENGATPAFGAFYVPGRQTVRVRLDAQVLPGGNPAQLSLAVRLLNSARQPIGTDQLGRDFVQFERTLDEGFYIIEVRTGAGSPRANFQLGLNADAFAGGVNVGGFLGPGQVGFGGFYLPESQEVRIRTQGLLAFAGVGASCLQITLLDADRRVIRTVP